MSGVPFRRTNHASFQANQTQKKVRMQHGATTGSSRSLNARFVRRASTRLGTPPQLIPNTRGLSCGVVFRPIRRQLQGKRTLVWVQLLPLIQGCRPLCHCMRLSDLTSPQSTTYSCCRFSTCVRLLIERHQRAKFQQKPAPSRWRAPPGLKASWLCWPCIQVLFQYFFRASQSTQTELLVTRMRHRCGHRRCRRQLSPLVQELYVQEP